MFARACCPASLAAVNAKGGVARRSLVRTCNGHKFRRHRVTHLASKQDCSELRDAEYMLKHEENAATQQQTV